VIHADAREVRLATWLSSGEATDEHTEVVCIVRGAILDFCKLVVG
jgi:hypothetical protein